MPPKALPAGNAGQLFVVALCDASSGLIGGVHVRKLDPQNGRLERIEPRIITRHLAEVFFFVSRGPGSTGPRNSAIRSSFVVIRPASPQAPRFLVG